MDERTKEEQTEDSQAPVSPSKTGICGPLCSCGVPPGSKKMKVVVILIVLLAVGSIFIYKALNTKKNVSSNITAKGGPAFPVAQAVPNAIPGAEAPCSGVVEQKKTEASPVQEDKPLAENGTTPESPKGGRTIGRYLEKFSTLNMVAVNQDAVFVYIPAKKGEPAGSKTNDAVLAVQRTLNSNGIKLGLYTLKVSSPDYSTISKQVQIPAILVASKGRGMGIVSGEVTESKLLQAFVASLQTGGCCPSSGGAASDCK